MKRLNYLMDHILYQIFKTILDISWRKNGEKTNNPSLRIYVYKMKNRIKFTIKRRYYLELLTPKTMHLLESIKKR